MQRASFALPPPEPRPLPLLSQRPFRMLSYSRFLSRLAQASLNFALILLIVRETDRAFLSSLLVAALVVPATISGIIAGTAADIFPKRPLVLLGNLVRAAACVFFVRSEGGVAAYYFVAVALSVAQQFSTTSEGAILPAIVERPSLARANAISQAVGGAAQLLGLGVLTPITLRLVDQPDILFSICAVLFVLAGFFALLIGRVRGVQVPEVGVRRGDQGSWWLAGWRGLVADSRVLQAAMELTLIAVALIVLSGLIPRYIEDVLGLPIDVGALILTPAAVGIVVGLRLAGFLAHRVPHGLLSTTGFITFVVVLALVAFVNEEAEFLAGYGAFSWLATISIDGGAALAMILVLPLGFAYAIVAVAGQTVINDLVPLGLQGRVNATQAAVAAALSAPPLLLAGALTDVAGVTPVMAGLAALTAAGAVANSRYLRRVRARTSGGPQFVGGG